MSNLAKPGLDTRARGALVAALLCITAFYALLWRFMRNIPIIDDYHAIMEYVLVLRQLPSLGSRLMWLIVSQHNDYKLVLLNVIVSLQWALTGRVSFLFLIVLGNVAVLGVLWLYWKNFLVTERDASRRIVLFLPVCFLLFQLNWVENLDWALNDIQTVGVLLFSLATVHFLCREGRRANAAAAVCGVLACCSSANGFALAPIGFVLLARRRRWAQLAVWTALFAACAAIYAYRYTPFNSGIHGSRTPLPQKAIFLASLMGAAVENMSRFPVKGSAIVLGAVLAFVIVYAVMKRVDRTQPFAFWTMVWILLTCAMVTQGRCGLGISLSLTGRYKIYSDMLLIFCYSYAVVRLDTQGISRRGKFWMYGAALASTVVLAAGSDYFGYKFLLNRQTRVASGINQYEANPARNPPMVGLTDQPIPQAEPQHDRLVLTEALKAGIYALPPKAQR
jgi:hypothetical protein